MCVCAVRDKKLSTQSHKSKDMFFHAQYMSLQSLPSSPHFISLYPIEAPFFLGFNFYQLHLQLSVRVDVRGGRVHVRSGRVDVRSGRVDVRSGRVDVRGDRQ